MKNDEERAKELAFAIKSLFEMLSYENGILVNPYIESAKLILSHDDAIRRETLQMIRAKL